MTDKIDLLIQLSKFDSPSGDEAELCDYLERELTSIDGICLHRIGDSLIAWRGKPTTALFAHIDTTGFTLGYERALIPLGSPSARAGDPLRQTGQPGLGHMADVAGRAVKLRGAQHSQPGSRWVYDRELTIEDGVISGPYLDNRAGVWTAIQVLESNADIAVAFTVGEESSGHGALVCGQYLSQELSITRAFISDITWHTKHIRCGNGPAISLRDRYAPRRRFLDQVLALADQSGIVYQREIESEGGSDGSYLQKSSIPIDWIFIGAPEEDAHTSNEKLHVSDLLGAVELLNYLIQQLRMH